MDHRMHQTYAHAADPPAEHKIAETHAGHDRHAGHSVAMFRDKFWLSFALTFPVVFWSADVQHWLGYKASSFPGSTFIAPVLGTIVFFYGGLVFRVIWDGPGNEFVRSLSIDEDYKEVASCLLPLKIVRRLPSDHTEVRNRSLELSTTYYRICAASPVGTRLPRRPYPTCCR
jgi:hypothetical protein